MDANHAMHDATHEMHATRATNNCNNQTYNAIKVTEQTHVPRMGHLLLDGVFDEEKYDRGMIKLLRKPSEDDEFEV